MKNKLLAVNNKLLKHAFDVEFGTIIVFKEPFSYILQNSVLASE